VHSVSPACLAPNEARAEVASHHLLEPFAALKGAAATAKAEALSAKLCRFGAGYVYEIALLDRSGRLVRFLLNASTGEILGPRNQRQPPQRD
jgi:hypothetical protein